MNNPQLSTQDSVAAGQKGYDANSFKSGATATVFGACRAVHINNAGTYDFYFAGNPSVAVPMKVVAGEQLNYSLVKIAVNGGTNAVAAGAITVIY